MFLTIQNLANRFALSKSQCANILNKAGIPSITPTNKRGNGCQVYYSEKEALPVLRKIKRRRQNMKRRYI